jgi:phosphonate transport system substrate-binding protein
MLPVEGSSTRDAFGGLKPIFDAITAHTGLHFEGYAGDTYAAAVEGLATGKGELGYLGPYTYIQAHKRGAAELLAVAVQPNGTSTYLAGIFCRKDSGINTLADLKGKSVAFGDVNSTSSFNYPCAMLLAAHVDPARDLGKVYLTGSHVNSLAALLAGKVDACCIQVSTFERGVKEGQVDPAKFKLLAHSVPIPGSPLVMHPKLPAALKAQLRKAFTEVATYPELGPNGLRAEDGRKLQRFDTSITDAQYGKMMQYLDPVTDDLKAAMLEKATNSQQ